MSLVFDEDVSRETHRRESFDDRVYKLAPVADLEVVAERDAERVIRASFSNRTDAVLEAIDAAKKQYSMNAFEHSSRLRFELDSDLDESSRRLANVELVDQVRLEIKSSRTKAKVVSIGPAHSRMWLFLVLLALLIGVLAGASFFGAVGLSAAVALYGVIATVGLSVTLYMLSSKITD